MPQFHLKPGPRSTKSSQPIEERMSD